MDERLLRIAFLAFCLGSIPAVADELPTIAELEQEGATIGRIVLRKSNVFDLSDPAENNWLYRLANRLHIVTRDSVIEKQLLVKPGEPFSAQRVQESARILRGNRYLFDAEVTPANYENGVVDLAVETRDVWTLGPDLSLSRSGGENRSRIGIEELNFLGRGQSLRITHEEDVDRRSNSFEFFDRHLGKHWLETRLMAADNSDGHSFLASVVRPFYSLDSRWTAGGRVLDDDRTNTFYALGTEAAEYRREQKYATLFAGWSAGLRGDWVRRWTTGFVYDDSRFDLAQVPTLPALIPSDRKLVYPFLGVELTENEYVVASNHDQIGKNEDFYMGTRLTATLGWADESTGADRSAIIWSASANTAFGSLQSKALLLSALAGGRHESGRSANTQLTANARYYWKQSDKQLFFATIAGTVGHALDLDNLVTIGGDNGLRGYPLRYQTGDSRLLVTLEQRVFTDWYPFRLVRVGAAVFADAGRAWGANPVGERRYGWLTDVGFGLRFGSTRSSSGKMIHLDIAFPLDGDDSIDRVQILLESKRSF